MADLERSASAVWHGSLREGNGTITANSGIFKDTPYSFATRFEHSPGTNPEELIAAAHAACFSMALSAQISRKEYKVHYIQTTATCVLTPQQPSGFKITKMKLSTRAKISDIDEATFKELADTAKKTCPVSQALAAIEVELDATLE